MDPRVTRQQVEAIVGCADRGCLLQDLLPALVEPLQSASEGECQEQSHQGEHGTLDGIQPGEGAVALPSKAARTQASPVLQQEQRAEEDSGGNAHREQKEGHSEKCLA